MSNLILELADVPESAERAVEETAAAVLKRTENHQCGSDGVNMLIHGENLSVLKQMSGSRESQNRREKFPGRAEKSFQEPEKHKTPGRSFPGEQRKVSGDI